MNSPEQIAATIVGTYDDQRLATDVAEEIFFALRDAGYHLIEGGDWGTRYGALADDWPPQEHVEAWWRHKTSTHKRDVWTGPWHPVEESNE